MKNPGTILVLVLLAGLLIFIGIEVMRLLRKSSNLAPTMTGTPTDEIPAKIETYDPPPIEPSETPTLLPAVALSVLPITNTVTPTNTSTQTLFPSPSATATNTPSPTPYIGPTPTPTLVHSSTVVFADNCDNDNNEGEIQYNCWYEVRRGETFQRIAIKFYRPQITNTTYVNRLVEILYNINRTPYGTYRDPLGPGVKIFIPQIDELEPQNIYERPPYPYCERNMSTVRPVLPCYFKVNVKEEGDTWNSISKIICLNDAFSENIQRANRKFIGGELTDNLVELTHGLVIVIPRPKAEGECGY